jgi:hypothetical protein
MLVSYGSGRERIDDNEKCRRIAGNFNCHANVVVQHGAHPPMEHIQGFTQRIAAAAAMVDEFVETTQNSNKTQLLASKRTLYSAH